MTDPDEALRAEVEKRMLDEALHSIRQQQVVLNYNAAVSVAVEMVKAERERAMQPPYPYFWRSIVQREKTRCHRLMNTINRDLLPNLRKWKQAFKSTRGTVPVMAKRIADLERQVKEAETHARNHHLEACESCAAMVGEREVAEHALAEHRRKWRHVAGCECHDKEQSNKCWSMDKSDSATQGKHTGLWLHRHPHRDPRCYHAPAESADAEVKP